MKEKGIKALGGNAMDSPLGFNRQNTESSAPDQHKSA